MCSSSVAWAGVRIGYRLVRVARGIGYATEAAGAMLEVAGREQHVPWVCSSAMDVPWVLNIGTGLWRRRIFL